MKTITAALAALLLSGCGTIGTVDDLEQSVVLLLSELTVGELQSRCVQQYVNEYGPGDLVEVFSAPPFTFSPVVGHQLAVAYDCGTIPDQVQIMGKQSWIDQALAFAEQYALGFLAEQCATGSGKIQIDTGEIYGIRWVVYDRCPD